LFDTEFTEYCAPKKVCGRDLVLEYVDAARSEGLRVGFYYSLMDWHHPDGAICAENDDARERFVDYIHGQVRELMSNYGKIDVLWYDVNWPLTAEGWEARKMNCMVRKLQPEIIINNRSGIPEDFSTPEQHIKDEPEGRAWETCMTMNESWGYHRADDYWKSPRQILNYLISCAKRGGNYLLNVGPKPDGSIPEKSVFILDVIGDWMKKYGYTIYNSEVCQVGESCFANFTRKGNILYMHFNFWPGENWALGGLQTKVKSICVLPSREPVDFDQDEFRIQFKDLSIKSPDSTMSVLELECESVPTRDTLFVRKNMSR
jgi:alpha-L-fucosidase